MKKRFLRLVGLFKCDPNSPSAPQKNRLYQALVGNVVLFLSASSLLAANTVEPLKELRAPDKTQWTVSIAPKPDAHSITSAKSKENAALDAKDSSAATLLQSIGAKEGGIYRVLNRYSDQTVEDWWIISQYQHLKCSGQQKITRLLSSQSRAWNLEESDFPELHWAIGQTPELQEIEGKKWLVIRMDAAKKPLTKRQQRDLAEMRQAIGSFEETLPAPPPASNGTLLLHLNPETGLPVRFEDVDRTYHYTFEKAPNLSKVIPADIKTEMMQFEQRRSELTRAPSAPKIRNRRK
jgi:hypothetical protein